MDISAVYQKAKIAPDDLAELIALTKELLNVANIAIFDTQHAFNVEARTSTINMLEALKEKHGL